MKKLLHIVTAIIISASLAACGTKITYTKELPYFPSYNGLKSTQFTPASKKTPLATARYTIQNATDTKVYQDYESMLKKDGWTITQDQKYFSISAKKDTHTANILIQKSGKDVILIVISK